MTHLPARRELPEDIVDLSGLIHDLAGQANSLALNAAIEAARAGEQDPQHFAQATHRALQLAARSAFASHQLAQGFANDATDADPALRGLILQLQGISKSTGDISTALAVPRAGRAQLRAGIDTLDQLTRQCATLIEHSYRTLGALASRSEHAPGERQAAPHVPHVPHDLHHRQDRSKAAAAFA